MANRKLKNKRPETTDCLAGRLYALRLEHNLTAAAVAKNLTLPMPATVVTKADCKKEWSPGHYSNWRIHLTVIQSGCGPEKDLRNHIMDKKWLPVLTSALLSGIALAVLISQLVMTNAHAQSTFEVFTTQDGVPVSAGVMVYHVKQGDNLLANINQRMGLDGVMDEETAATYITQQLQDALIAQMTGLTKAAQYQLKYFPAVVKDSKYVIYGTTNPKAFNGIAH